MLTHVHQSDPREVVKAWIAHKADDERIFLSLRKSSSGRRLVLRCEYMRVDGELERREGPEVRVTVVWEAIKWVNRYCEGLCGLRVTPQSYHDFVACWL